MTAYNYTVTVRFPANSPEKREEIKNQIRKFCHRHEVDSMNEFFRQIIIEKMKEMDANIQESHHLAGVFPGGLELVEQWNGFDEP